MTIVIQSRSYQTNIRYMHPFFVGMRTYSALRCNDWMNFKESADTSNSRKAARLETTKLWKDSILSQLGYRSIEAILIKCQQQFASRMATIAKQASRGQEKECLTVKAWYEMISLKKINIQDKIVKQSSKGQQPSIMCSVPSIRVPSCTGSHLSMPGTGFSWQMQTYHWPLSLIRWRSLKINMCSNLSENHLMLDEDRNELQNPRVVKELVRLAAASLVGWTFFHSFGTFWKT